MNLTLCRQYQYGPAIFFSIYYKRATRPHCCLRRVILLQNSDENFNNHDYCNCSRRVAEISGHHDIVLKEHKNKESPFTATSLTRNLIISHKSIILRYSPSDPMHHWFIGSPAVLHPIPHTSSVSYFLTLLPRLSHRRNTETTQCQEKRVITCVANGSSGWITTIMCRAMYRHE